MIDTRFSQQELVQSLSTRVFPKTLGEMLDWSDWLWTHHGTYSQALVNAVRYFLGEISIESADEDDAGSFERDRITDELIGDYGIFGLLGRAGDEYVQWGNSFASAAPAIRRTLHCPLCGFTGPVDQFDNLRYSGGSFRGKCPSCEDTGVLDCTERTDDTAPLQVTFWNPRLIDIVYCPSTKKCEYFLHPSKEWRESFSAQDRLFLATTPREFLDAVDGDLRIKLDNDFFIHLKPPLPSTLEDTMRGWGLPLYTSSFGKVVELMMLSRYNEAILSDYLIPFRVLSPPSAGAAPPEANALLSYNMGDFRERMNAMIQAHRSNPTTIHVAPFPIQYQIMGGEAKQLIPFEVIDKVQADLLSSMCIPIEFREMTLANSGGPPVGLRRFEKVWASHIAALDRWLQWLCDCRTTIQHTPAVKARLVKTSIYDDDMSRDIKAKLAVGGSISMGTGLAPLGVDYGLEQIRMRDERARQLRLDEEIQRQEESRAELQGAMREPHPGAQRLAQQQQQGGAPPRGMPSSAATPPAEGGAPADVDQLWAQAEELAPQIMTAPPEERRSMLINLSKTNPQMHAFVKKMIEQMEQQAGQQGVAAARQGAMG